VRVSGAGLGCPDWPKCFGRWIPPASISQLPPEIDPSTFNVTLAWIEYINRLIGVCIGILIFITTVLAFKYARRIPRILYPTLAALILVGVEGWQGSQVISSKLEPFIVTIHMVLAFLIVSCLLYATLQAHRLLTGRTAPASPESQALKRWLAPLWLFSIVAIGLGTQVRSDIETLVRQFPRENALTLLGSLGPVHVWHLILGGLIIISTWYVGAKILAQRGRLSALSTTSTWVLMAVALIQVAIGIVLVSLALPALLQVFHLWFSSLYIGALLVLHFSLSHHEGITHA
jgi:cytochrome c oxidase assembly protein subunit 15